MIFPKHRIVKQNDDVFEQYFSLIAALKLSDIAGVKNIASLWKTGLDELKTDKSDQPQTI